MGVITNMYEWKVATNAIYLDDEVAGKGRQFKCRFLVPGLVKYDFGVCLLTKENADKFIQNFVGCPVIINHQDLNNENAKNSSVGNIFSVWFDEKDGYYWCNGIITDKKAIELIEKGYSVSCQYVITEYRDNTEKKLHNGNEYDKIIENGRPEHLAIVNNPRYEGAIIAVNAILEEKELQAENAQESFADQFKDTLYTCLAEGIANRLGELIASNEDKWITIHPHGKGTKGVRIKLRDGQTFDDAIKELQERNKKQGYLPDKKREAWHILSIATGKSVKWLQMRYRKNAELIQDLLEGTDRIDDFPAQYYVELLQANYKNSSGNDSIGIGEKVAQKVLDDLLNDNFYDETYLKEQEESEYYQKVQKEKIQKLKSSVKSQFVKDLIEKEKELSESLFTQILKKVKEKSGTKEADIMINDFNILDKLSESNKEEDSISDDDIPTW